jgi:outer membrane lipoprotein-sorting protein
MLRTALAALMLSTPAMAQDANLAAISDYLNGIDTAEAAFRQGNPDGSISSGVLKIDRPGLMRFDYAGPGAPVVISDGWWVAVVDRASNAEPQRYPLSATPLKLLLSDNIDLNSENMVRAVEEREGHTIVTAQDPEQPEIGTIRMVFAADPVELREWAVTNEAGQTTFIVLDTLAYDVPMERRDFAIEWEALQR